MPRSYICRLHHIFFRFSRNKSFHTLSTSFFFDLYHLIVLETAYQTIILICLSCSEGYISIPTKKQTFYFCGLDNALIPCNHCNYGNFWRFILKRIFHFSPYFLYKNICKINRLRYRYDCESCVQYFIIPLTWTHISNHITNSFLSHNSKGKKYKIGAEHTRTKVRGRIRCHGGVSILC